MSILFPHSLAANRCCSRRCIHCCRGSGTSATLFSSYRQAVCKQSVTTSSRPGPVCPAASRCMCTVKQRRLSRCRTVNCGSVVVVNKGSPKRCIPTGAAAVAQLFLIPRIFHVSFFSFLFVRADRIHHTRCASDSVWSSPRCLKARRAHSQWQDAKCKTKGNLKQ